jgi:hypothetical protein
MDQVSVSGFFPLIIYSFMTNLWHFMAIFKGKCGKIMINHQIKGDSPKFSKPSGDSDTSFFLANRLPKAT